MWSRWRTRRFVDGINSFVPVDLAYVGDVVAEPVLDEVNPPMDVFGQRLKLCGDVPTQSWTASGLSADNEVELQRGFARQRKFARESGVMTLSPDVVVETLKDKQVITS